MNYIDMHAHMVSRTTDDYHAMALSGCLAVTEPAFWSGRDRLGPEAFADYFDHLTTFEPARAREYGIAHYAWLCLNPKEGEDRELTRQVLKIIPEFLQRPTVLGIGEIGLNRVTRNEMATFLDHVELALEHHQLIHIHTPHLEDKYKGTRVMVEALAADARIEPGRVMIDHAEEHTAELILSHGFWTGITLYPKTKASPARAIDMIELYGSERLIVASACDWGPSQPLAVPEFIFEARRRGHDEATIRKIVLDNPQRFLGQSPKFVPPSASRPWPGGRVLVHDAHLTYCTNIHPASGMDGVRRSLDEYTVPLRARLSPDAPFGVGLRLSGEESAELLRGTALADFRAFLDERGLYVFTLNGFPYGPFHGQAVKAQVHAPDWRDPERVAYTLRLVDILAALLPEGQEGSISTSPLSHAAWVDAEDPQTWAVLTENVIQVIEALVRLREASGVFIHLDMEPEPDGLLQRSADLAAFYQDHLLRRGARLLAERLGTDEERARAHLRDHFQACFDVCHVAVMYEDPAGALALYRDAGMQIGKIQLSSALRLPLPDDAQERAALAAALAPFAEGTYLHQVVARTRSGTLVQYPDLPPALADIHRRDVTEWRVHFHVPVFLEQAGAFGSTQGALLGTLERLRPELTGRHLEVETYTWDVLPPELKRPLGESIARELEWVRDVL